MQDCLTKSSKILSRLAKISWNFINNLIILPELVWCFCSNFDKIWYIDFHAENTGMCSLASVVPYNILKFIHQLHVPYFTETDYISLKSPTLSS